MIICVTGLAGAGKSTLASMLKEHLVCKGYKVAILNTDSVHSGLFKEEMLTEYDFFTKDFSNEQLRLTYNGLNTLAERILSTVGDSYSAKVAIICDGSFRKHAQRIKLRLVADTLGMPFMGVYVKSSFAQASGRARQRLIDGGSLGLILPEDYEEPLASDFTVITNEGSVDDLRQKIQLLAFSNRFAV